MYNFIRQKAGFPVKNNDKLYQIQIQVAIVISSGRSL